MLRFCLKSCLVGIGVGPACLLAVSLVPSLKDIFLLVILMAFPSGILMFGDTPGIAAAQSAILLGICSLANGMLYVPFGAP